MIYWQIGRNKRAACKLLFSPRIPCLECPPRQQRSINQQAVSSLKEINRQKKKQIWSQNSILWPQLLTYLGISWHRITPSLGSLHVFFSGPESPSPRVVPPMILDDASAGHPTRDQRPDLSLRPSKNMASRWLGTLGSSK